MQERQTTTRAAAGHDKLKTSADPDPPDAIPFVAELASRYQINAIQPLLRVCRSAATRTELNIAVLGRFKAGKSSFLNHFVGRDLLPVGVVPVTSVVTELQWGPQDQAEVHFLNDRTERVQIEAIGDFIAESQNPENSKRVRAVCARFPELARYKGLRFIDTPGLDSVLAHNTEASLAWVPNVDLALVAIGVDPPLSQQDLSLIRKLFEYTPKVCLLLTKVDVLSEREIDEVLQFVRTQLNRNFNNHIEVFPYSIRSGFEVLKSSLQERFIDPALSTIREQKQEIVNHKIQTVLRECGDYVQLTLRSVEIIDAQRKQLRDRAFGERESFSDTNLELQLVARHNIGLARNHIEKTLTAFERLIQLELRDTFEHQYAAWQMSFVRMLDQFETWVRGALTSRLTILSASHKPEFFKPVLDVQRQYVRVLQAFRDRLSAQMLETFGVPLRTTETEIEPESLKAPDVNIGRIFDHNWELLSPLIPMALFRGALRARLLDRIDYETTKNVSRLTTQWANIVTATISSMQQEAQHRLEDLIMTVEHLTAASATRAPDIRLDLQNLQRLEASLKGRW